MNFKEKRKSIQLTQKELAREAGVASSSVNRVENGGDVLLSTRRKVTAALKKLEDEYKENGFNNRMKKKTVPQSRRRPDLAHARKILGITQKQLAEEWNVDSHEISKIESGYDIHDFILEEMVDGQLRAQLKEKGIPWYGATEAMPPAGGRAVVINQIQHVKPTQHGCQRCDCGILWGPDGKPHVCPICEGKG